MVSLEKECCYEQGFNRSEKVNFVQGDAQAQDSQRILVSFEDDEEGSYRPADSKEHYRSDDWQNLNAKGGAFITSDHFVQ